MNGVINVFKERGMTSHDVVYKVRKIFGTRKVGHAGTLDPEASGVLPVLINRATKIADYLHVEDKEYIAELTLGEERETDDFTGELVSVADVPNLNYELINSVFNSFVGESMQYPPIYSAKKVNGKKLYQYAREGLNVEIQPAKIVINKIELVSFTDKSIIFKVECSKGTYIRSLCRDIANAMNTVGYMSYLIRTKSGGLSIADSITLNRLELMENPYMHLIAIEDALSSFKSVHLDRDKYLNIINGQYVEYDGEIEDTSSLVKLYAGDFIGLGIISYEDSIQFVKLKKLLADRED